MDRATKISVSCMGSREDYGLSSGLHSLGLLDNLYTDIYFPSWVGSLAESAFLPSSLRALFAQSHRELPYKKVNSQLMLGTRFRLEMRKRNPLNLRQKIRTQFESKFSKSVARKIGTEDQLIGFTGASLETFMRCKELGIRTSLDQIDPGLREWEVVYNEFVRYPGWEGGREDARWDSTFEARVKQELELADEIIVNSEYSRRAIVSWVGEKRITVLPIASHVPCLMHREVNLGKTLRVLYLGTLCLRKGGHLAVMAIDKLVRSGFDVELIIAGPSRFYQDKLQSYKGHTYIGSVLASDVAPLMDSCDVLLFPTLSDGFGMVQVEAISRGLPVITTTSSAEVIRHGVSGFIVEAGSVDAIVDCIEIYCRDREILQRHAINALSQAEHFSVGNYRKLLKEKFLG